MGDRPSTFYVTCRLELKVFSLIKDMEKGMIVNVKLGRNKGNISICAFCISNFNMLDPHVLAILHPIWSS